ncbi:hypothetical protein NDA11_005986 [Ustilago hordei]|nr:hypothetical protein NDA10_006205 [Ustilago hordei]KAJ1585425.1 hypothetical protein NDA15_006093 [Ustilago hordei]KAJ1588209.1 hypothetical protein NDA12_005059 [Ustilago hordei]KAJ1593211.1 hypothetical protein NDA11_005986 [Ustilago hordei]
MALNVQGVSPRDLFLEAPQELLQPEMQLPQALAPQPSKCICTHCHKNLPITSVTPGSPTGPACISAPDPTPNPGLDTNFPRAPAPHLPSLPSASMLPTNTLPAPNNPGESPVRRLFPWIPTETINAVYKDLLWPSNLSKLHNMTAAMPSGEKVTLSLGTYKLALTLPAPMPSTKTFLKAIPNLVSFCQAWIVYTALCAVASPDCMLGPTLAGFLVHVAELDQHFDWTYIANYILTVCEKRFGHADMDTWSRHNREAFQDKLSIAPTKTPKTTAAPTEPKRVGTNNMVCLCWNNSTCTSNCGWSHTCLVCGTKNHPSHSCQNLTKFKPSQPSSVAAETASQPNIKARGTA